MLLRRHVHVTLSGIRASSTLPRAKSIPISQQVRKTTDMIDLASKNTTDATDISWKRDNHNLEDVMKRVRTHQTGVPPPSIETMAYESEAAEDIRTVGTSMVDLSTELPDTKHMYEPGSYVEIFKSSGTYLFGVVLAEIYDTTAKRWRLNILGPRGEVFAPRRDDVCFAAPHFVPRDLAERAGIAVVAENAIHQAARVRILRQLRALVHHLERATGYFNPDRVDVYNTVRSQDHSMWSKVTVSEVLALIKSKVRIPEMVTVVAVHRWLLTRPDHFIVDPQYRLNETFRVRPKADFDRLEQVRQWAHSSDEGPVASFADKARTLIANSGVYSTATLMKPPSRTFHQGPIRWTSDDKTIIQFLVDSMNVPNTSQVDPYTIPQSHIVRQVFPDQTLIDEHGVHTILQGVGAVPPWQDWYSTPKALQMDLPKTEVRNKVIIDAYVKARGQKAPAGQVLGSHDLYPADPLDSVRHDWGNMPVYIIDDPNAHELDDGISIENVAGDPDSFWCHIHIADPASFIPPGHVFATEARRQVETRYLVTATLPLFPEALVQDGMSLRDVSVTNGEPQRVLTFSARVNKLGEIVDHKVRAGLIRQAIRLTYDSVDLAMGAGLLNVTYPIDVPDEVKPILESRSSTVADFTPSQRQDMTTMYTVASWLEADRFRRGCFMSAQPVPRVSMVGPDTALPQPVWNTNKARHDQPTVFGGMPPLLFALDPPDAAYHGTRGVVSEFMKLSSRVASLFHLDHSAPALRRVTSRPMTHTDEQMQEILDMRNPASYVPYMEVYKRLAMQIAGTYSVAPLAHWALGVPEGEGYTRATSPLRRYTDMVTHWQIHALLLGQKPIYDEQELTMFAEESELSLRTLKRTAGLHTASWLLIAMKQYFDFNSSRDPSFQWHWDGQIFSPPIRHSTMAMATYEVWVPTLAMKFMVEDTRPFSKVNLERLVAGQPVTIQPGHVRFGTKPALTAKPVGEWQ